MYLETELKYSSESLGLEIEYVSSMHRALGSTSAL